MSTHHQQQQPFPGTAAVDSFSQLPFFRPPAAPAVSAMSAQQRDIKIRLFGIDVSSREMTGEEEEDDQELEDEDRGGSGGGGKVAAGEAAGEVVERKFECNYCCRRFPTSQALGGHQNAHKRERQLAKRAQLAAAAAAHRGYYMATTTGGSPAFLPGDSRRMYGYGLLGYQRSAPGPFPAWVGAGQRVLKGSPVSAPLPTPLGCDMLEVGAGHVVPITSDMRPAYGNRGDGRAQGSPFVVSSGASASPASWAQKDGVVSLDLHL